MSDETQPQPGAASADEPVTAAEVEEPTAAPDQPRPDDPGADEPVTEAAGPAASADESPTTEAAVPRAAAATDPQAPPPASTPAPVETRDRGRGVFVPAWVAVVVGVLLVAGLGFAIGWIAAPNDDSSSSNAVAVDPGGQSQLPTLPNGRTFPGNGNGNDDRNDDDDSSDDQPTAAAGGAYLGVSIESAANEAGATITSVAAGSPAADAGLKAGDVVTAVDDTKVTSALDLVRAVRGHDVDDTVTVTYTRDGTSATAKVTLDSRPTTPQSVS